MNSYSRLVIASILFFVFSISVYAQEVTVTTAPPTSDQTTLRREGDVVTLKENETINRDFFGAGERVELFGTVNGDVYVAGGMVLIEGTVNGDVLAAGGTVTIAGTVTQNVRVVGGNLMIIGSVGRNVSIAGGNITIANPAKIAGNIVVGGGNVELSAPVSGNVVGGAGNLTISSTINGDVEVGAGSLRITSNASIAGNLTYSADEKSEIDPAATIGGTVTKKDPAQFVHDLPKEEDINKGFAEAWFTFRLIGFLAALVVMLLLTKLMPNYSKAMGEVVARKSWQSLGVGFAGIVGIPICAILLIITILGAPLGIGMLLVYPIGLYLAKFPVAMWIGIKLGPKMRQHMGITTQMMIGLVVIYLLSLIPVVGGITNFLTIFFGFGALIIAKYQLFNTLKGKKVL